MRSELKLHYVLGSPREVIDAMHKTVERESQGHTLVEKIIDNREAAANLRRSAVNYATKQTVINGLILALGWALSGFTGGLSLAAASGLVMGGESISLVQAGKVALESSRYTRRARRIERTLRRVGLQQ